MERKEGFDIKPHADANFLNPSAAASIPACGSSSSLNPNAEEFHPGRYSGIDCDANSDASHSKSGPSGLDTATENIDKNSPLSRRKRVDLLYAALVEESRQPTNCKVHNVACHSPRECAAIRRALRKHGLYRPTTTSRLGGQGRCGKLKSKFHAVTSSSSANKFEWSRSTLPAVTIISTVDNQDRLLWGAFPGETIISLVDEQFRWRPWNTLAAGATGSSIDAQVRWPWSRFPAGRTVSYVDEQVRSPCGRFSTATIASSAGHQFRKGKSPAATVNTSIDDLITRAKSPAALTRKYKRTAKYWKRYKQGRGIWRKASELCNEGQLRSQNTVYHKDSSQSADTAPKSSAAAPSVTGAAAKRRARKRSRELRGSSPK